MREGLLEIINRFSKEIQEWLFIGNDTYPLLRELYRTEKPVGNSLNRKLMRDFRIYMAVGGMLQAVEAYVDGHNFKEIDKVKRGIIDLYKADFFKVDETGLVGSMYDSVPAQLATDKRSYVISAATGKKRIDKDLERLHDLLDSKTVLPCYNVLNPTIIRQKGERMKQFNTTAVCIPSKHYMVDLSERVKEIKKLVDDGKYFTINRARQYGKTTTLKALQEVLKNQYVILSLSFEGIAKAGYQTEGEFVQTLSRLILDRNEFYGVDIPSSMIDAIKSFCDRDSNKVKMDELYREFRRWIAKSDKGIVMIIDEVDSSTNNQVFLDFLGLLRDGYIAREADGIPAFQSVILAGVTDVKHLKSKIRNEYDRKENSPWNIATDFTIDMSLSEDGIKGMLDEYEADHHTGMNTAAIAKSIRAYTNGYPFLVSRICQLIDEVVSKTMSLSEAWTGRGMDEAVKLILAENNTLFQSLTKNLNNYPELKAAIRSILMEGTKLTWNPDQKDIVQMQMYGLIRNEHNTVRISNRIFETRLYNLFLSEEEMKNNIFAREGELAKNQFVSDGKLNMRLIMERFIETYTEIYGPLEERFKEKDGREQFLLYLKPIINGTGNYYIEAQTRDQTRTDVIVDYLGQQYIIELKIWRGPRYNADGEKQLSEYLDYWNLNTGYMLSFNFNKKKETGVHLVHVGDKLLYEGMI